MSDDQKTRDQLLGNVSPVLDSEGNPQGAIAAFTDITEPKPIAIALRESESRLNLAIHQAGMGTWDTDLVSGQTFWSRNHFQLLGYEPDSDGLATFEMWQSRVHPDDFDRVMQEYELAKRDHGLYSPEYRIIRVDTGEVVWLSPFGRFLYDDNGKAIRFSGIFFDSTERKRAEEALRESELRLKTILQTTNEGFWLIDNDTVTIDINPRMCAILGRNREEVLGRKIFDFVDDENRAVFEQQIKTRVVGQLGAYEIALTRPDGSQVFCLNNATPLVDGSGKKIGSFGMWKDITERKQAEKNIQESERKYRELVELANSIILRWTHDGRITFLNEFGLRFFGYSSEEIIGRRVADTIVPKTETGGRDMQQLMKRICVDPGSFEQNINENVRRNGERAWIAWTNKIVWNRQHRVSEILSVGTDVTERKLAEVALRESEERFSLAMEATKDGLWDWNLAADEVYYSPGYLAMLGYVPGEVPADFGAWTDRIHPEDKDAALKANIDCIENRRDDFEVEFRMQTRNGEWRWILGRGKVVGRDRDGRAVRMVGTHTDITARKEVEETLRKSEERYRKLFEDAVLGIFRSSTEGKIIAVNPAWARMFGFESPEEAERVVTDMGGDFYADPARRDEIVRMMLKTGKPVCEEISYRRKDGSNFTGNLHLWDVCDKDGKHLYLEGFVEDITERKRAEQEHRNLQAQLYQAQRMESVGRLAGGVAHDSNNMLGIILGYAEMALLEVDPEQPAHAHLQEIVTAAHRSADMVRQLLAFARKQAISPKVLDLNETLEGMLKMLRRLIGEDIDLSWHPGAGLWAVKMDQAQIDQILANLCVNSRDAISGVGRITIETRNTFLNETYCAEHEEAVPGEYVLLTFGDNGCGMDKEILDRVFEPFFTTKEVGKGTGLGLATTYGIVKQNNGFIDVFSVPGQGTTFKIYLPRHEGKAEQAGKDIPVGPVRAGETILLVEDEPGMLNMGAEMLTRLGYHVLTAGTPGEAIRLAEAHSSEIRLLITDVVMPEMNGSELSSRLLSICPNLTSVFMSGHTAEIIERRGVLEPQVNFIQKPFSMQDLSAKVRETLDAR
ncbi:MAG: PAS domain S-box protein [Syntrophobacteraceae bacterium]